MMIHDGTDGGYSKMEKLNERGDTPLHKASRHGHTPVVRALVRSGAKMYTRNVQGKTPEDVAVTKRRTDILDYFRRLLDMRQKAFGWLKRRRNVVVVENSIETYDTK